jgi:hypothetical protein
MFRVRSKATGFVTPIEIAERLGAPAVGVSPMGEDPELHA